MPAVMSTCRMTERDVHALIELIDGNEFQQLLQWDSGYEVADKYLISIAMIYLMRAGYTEKQLTYFNLIVALYLAHEVEEEDWLTCACRPDLIRCAFGMREVNEQSFRLFMKKKERLWKALSYNVIVKREESDSVMEHVMRGNGIWDRNRCPDLRFRLRPSGRTLCCSARDHGSNPTSSDMSE